MANAKKEFIEETKGKLLKCAFISNDYLGTNHIKEFILPINYSSEEYYKFLNDIDFDYDDDYGGQELFGFIWYKDGTWSERYEYDGLEYWDYKAVPEIPDACFNRNINEGKE